MDSIRKLHKELLRVWWFFQHVARKRGSVSASVLLTRDLHSIRSINSLALCLMNLKVHRHTKSIKVSVLILERVWYGFFFRWRFTLLKLRKVWQKPQINNVYGEILQLYYFSPFFFLECLFRSTDLPTRKRYVKLVESVKENGGEVRFVTSF